MLEVKVAPPTAEIRYSTNGSDPLTNGGVYEEAFKVEPNQLIQVVGAKGTYLSEKLSIKAPAQGGKLEIDKQLPLRWKRKKALSTTSESYQFVAALKKFKSLGKGVSIASKKENGKWMQLSADQERKFEADKIENFLQFIQDNSEPDSKLNLTISEMEFENGQLFLDFIKDLSEDYKPEEIEQKR